MIRAVPYLLGFLMPLLVVAGAQLRGWWTFVPVAFLYGLLPALDALSGLNRNNAPDEERPALEANPWFRLVTWLWVPVQLGLVAWGFLWVVAERPPLLDVIGVTLSVGLTCGAIGITFAHELVHRAGRFERALGEILLAAVSYPHFAIEHVHGHHRHVATPRDPATARYGEAFYAFLPRTVLGGVRSALAIEAERLRRRSRAPWHPSNRFWRYGLEQALLYGAAAWVGGPAGVAYVAAQAATAVFLLEVINYVEHYGLQRREVSPGRFERVMPWHSWNSSHRVSNWLLINLARHSDHHYLASKRYQVLDHLEAAPQLPAGYGTMFIVALLPPLWRKVMHPRVAAWRERYLPG
jgi:alkane 1-monooxygenase